MTDCALAVEGLRKRYPGPGGLGFLTAVDGVAFTVGRGEIVGFLGPNGAGKTTTLKCILGLLRPTSGSISVFGLPPAAAGARRRMGYIPENPDYDDSFTPAEYLGFFGSMRGLSWGGGDTASLLERVGLARWSGERIRKFSKGMRQKMSLALALQGSPDLLVMDEPTGGFDPLMRKEFRDILLEENRRGAACLLSSHILSDIEAVCSRALILARGRVVREGPMSDLLAVRSTYRVLLRPPGGPEEERIVTEESLQAEIDAARAAGLEILGVGREIASLEDVFLSATGGPA